MISKLPDGRWQTKLTVTAAKNYADGKGKETAAPLRDSIDVGVFAARPGIGTFSKADVDRIERRTIATGTQVITAGDQAQAGLCRGRSVQQVCRPQFGRQCRCGDGRVATLPPPAGERSDSAQPSRERGTRAAPLPGRAAQVSRSPPGGGAARRRRQAPPSPVTPGLTRGPAALLSCQRRLASSRAAGGDGRSAIATAGCRPALA